MKIKITIELDTDEDPELAEKLIKVIEEIDNAIRT